MNGGTHQRVPRNICYVHPKRGTYLSTYIGNPVEGAKWLAFTTYYVSTSESTVCITWPSVGQQLPEHIQ